VLAVHPRYIWEWTEPHCAFFLISAEAVLGSVLAVEAAEGPVLAVAVEAWAEVWVALGSA
jgi:hypothetical protein